MPDLSAFFQEYMPLTREEAMSDYDLAEWIREEEQDVQADRDLG